MRRFPKKDPVPRPLAGGGWTVVELLVAAALLLVGLLALVPLFVRAVRDVARGAAISKAAVFGQDGLERGGRLRPGLLPIPTEYLRRRQRAWSTTPPSPPEQAAWLREGSVRYVELSALEDGLVDDSELTELAPEEAALAILALTTIQVRGVSTGEVLVTTERFERPWP